MRLVAWNVGGLEQRLAALPDLVARAGHPDALLLQDVRVLGVEAAAVARATSALPGYVCHYSFNRDYRNAGQLSGRQYGVATFLRRPAPLVFDVPSWDLEGRVVVSRIAGLSIVNVLGVNGNKSRYFERGRDTASGDRHAFKRRAQSRIFQLAHQLRAHGPVIMAGHWNVARLPAGRTSRVRPGAPEQTARRELEAHLVVTGLVDVPQARSTSERHPLAYFLMSQELAASARALEIALGSETGDHAPLAIELDVARERGAALDLHPGP